VLTPTAQRAKKETNNKGQNTATINIDNNKNSISTIASAIMW
jgi:hypothetical protein